MLANYIGVLNLNEEEGNLKSLTVNRPLASVIIFGRYRVIDFILSNLVNAGVKTVGIFGQTHSRSLVDHLGTGKPWDLNRKNGGLFIFNYSLENPPISDAKLLKNNMEFFYRSSGDHIILASSRMIYKIDFNEVARYHEEMGNDITVLYKKVNDTEGRFLNCDVLNLGDENEVLSVGRLLGLNASVNISMETFILKKELLIDFIYRAIEKSKYNSFKECIYDSLDKLKVGAYEYKGYLSCVNSVRNYYLTSMDILDLRVRRELFFEGGKIYTKTNDSPPTKYYEGCEVENSLISNGCLIKGRVKNSIISRGVEIKEGAVVEDSIVFSNCIIEKGAFLKNAILDKNVIIEEGKRLIGDKKFPVVIEKGEIVENLLRKAGENIR
ncbi:glucose-1-phosphate adenylyltransferase [Thermoanaerobacter uzonensis DSM 18761]|uniref:Glucose-1-phosphate adenylyltransferase n=1 Tax=Thermoanaerobacter uzonensis DSM 18761 TaxID=1123369 RepID=A0A1M4SYX9_9THEO|nr:glucose-1-phosphate adenylyltransferase subunit GlgD [Thermoanaerobacter uzonensis]SHE37391.1 glucose-1-phosphate adenylyltransferase [Thermoanaerobacter uzonensis DSM 18761]